MSNAPEYFLLRFQDESEEDIVGYVCGTLTASAELTHETMYKHDASGHLLCIHSVLVKPSHRRQGIASQMLKDYIDQMIQSRPQVQKMALLCKENLIGLYQSAGFVLQGASDVEHGQDTWYDMTYTVEHK